MVFEFFSSLNDSVILGRAMMKPSGKAFAHKRGLCQYQKMIETIDTGITVTVEIKIPDLGDK